MPLEIQVKGVKQSLSTVLVVVRRSASMVPDPDLQPPEVVDDCVVCKPKPSLPAMNGNKLKILYDSSFVFQ